jgi:MerR family transcriptional regulator, heat shock protein HspR
VTGQDDGTLGVDDMSVKKSDPIYPISVAAKLLTVHPRTLRIYEEEGLVKPARQGNKRYYSENDIEWIRCLRTLIHEKGISIPGIKMLLDLVPCWEITNCVAEKRENCSAFVDRTAPCWKLAGNACGKGIDQCNSCEVFLEAMNKAKKASVLPGEGGSI